MTGKTHDSHLTTTTLRELVLVRYTPISDYGEEERHRTAWREKTGTKQRCEHGCQQQYCRDCGGVSVCIRGHQKRLCNDCGGHGRQKRQYKDCGGTSVCIHGQEIRCVECKSSGPGDLPDSHALEQEQVRSVQAKLISQAEENQAAQISVIENTQVSV